MVEMGVKMGSFHSFVRPKWSAISFGETHLRYILRAFLVPKTAHCKGILGCSIGQYLSQRAQNGPRTLD